MRANSEMTLSSHSSLFKLFTSMMMNICRNLSLPCTSLSHREPSHNRHWSFYYKDMCISTLSSFINWLEKLNRGQLLQTISISYGHHARSPEVINLPDFNLWLTHFKTRLSMRYGHWTMDIVHIKNMPILRQSLMEKCIMTSGYYQYYML